MFDNQGDEYTAEGVDTAALPGTLDLGTVGGSLAGLYGDTIAVDTVTAGDLHLHVGSEFGGWFGDGARVTLRVAAIYRRGLGFANLTLPAAILRPHTATGLDSLVLVADSPGSDRASVSVALTRAIHGLDPAAKVATPAGYQAAVNAQIARRDRRHHSPRHDRNHPADHERTPKPAHRGHRSARVSLVLSRVTRLGTRRWDATTDPR